MITVGPLDVVIPKGARWVDSEALGPVPTILFAVRDDLARP